MVVAVRHDVCPVAELPERLGFPQIYRGLKLTPVGHQVAVKVVQYLAGKSLKRHLPRWLVEY